MSKSLIQVANTSNQTVDVNSLVNLGSTIRRFGCNCYLSGSSVIEVKGEGYYTISGAVTLAPTVEGDVAIAVQKDGVIVAGSAVAATAAGAGDYITLPVIATIRKGCGCEGASSVSVIVTEGASTVTNVSLRIEKA